MKDCRILQHWRGFLCTLPLLTLLTGCAMGNMSSADMPVSGTLSISGVVHGGQQAVSGGTIQLYTAGTSGNGSAATAMITGTTVTTGPDGSFNITGDYSCAHSTDQVYLTATGGNPGLTSGTNNDALVLLAAIGNCGLLSSGTIQFLSINEVTTVAAVYALAPFISSSATNAYANIGATSTNSAGLANAFLDAQLLANIGTGAAATLGSGLTIQSGKLYALADAIAPCVNSASSSSTNCAALVSAATPSSGSAPTANTLAAALSIVQNPGDPNIVGPVFNLINTQAPFTTTLSSAPSDWTMTLTISNGGLSTPTALSVDHSGNVWVASYNGFLSAYNPQGAPFNSSPFGSGTIAECFGLAIDASGNIWVSNYETPLHSGPKGSVTEFLGAASGTPGSIVTDTATSSPYFYDSSINFPTAVAADTNGDIAVANYAGATATIYNPTTTVYTDNLGSGYLSEPAAIAFDSSHGIWVANEGGSTVTHISSTGTIKAHPTCCSGADGIALDASGNAWISNYSGGYVYASSPTGSELAMTSNGGLSGTQPVGIAVDSSQHIWVADGNGGVITELADAGFPISPSTGYGVDAKLTSPRSIAPDASGNLWVADFSNNTLILFFGIAAPTVTPVQPVPSAP